MEKLKHFLKKFWIFRILWKHYKKLRHYILSCFSKKYKHSNPAVIQLIENYSPKDAIGNMAREISDYLASEGIENYIISNSSNSQFNDYFYTPKFKIHKKDTIIYHMSTSSSFTNLFFEVNNINKIMIYHNITPDKYMEGQDRKECVKAARKELSKLINVPNLSICVSKYNESELKQLGYKCTTVIPVIHNVESLLKYKTENKLNKNRVFITVGRFAPNKCIIDVINTFSEYYKLDNKSSLYIIGKPIMPRYYSNILKTIKEKRLTKCVHIETEICDKKLAYFYSNCNGYLCMSEHEGFCVPLVEAMAFGVPIFAYNSTAIPETLNGCGVLLKDKNFVKNAHIIYDTLNNPNKLQEIIHNEIKRYADFNNNISLEQYRKIIYNNKYIKRDQIIALYSKIKHLYENKQQSLYPISLRDFLIKTNSTKIECYTKKRDKIRSYIKLRFPKAYYSFKKIKYEK